MEYTGAFGIYNRQQNKSNELRRYMKRLKTIRKVAVVLFLLSLFCTVDLGLNFLFNTEPGIHDGSYGVHSLLHAVFGIFGDSGWSFDRFFAAFNNAAWITYALLVVNVVLYFCQDKQK